MVGGCCCWLAVDLVVAPVQEKLSFFFLFGLMQLIRVNQTIANLISASCLYLSWVRGGVVDNVDGCYLHGSIVDGHGCSQDMGRTKNDCEGEQPHDCPLLDHGIWFVVVVFPSQGSDGVLSMYSARKEKRERQGT